MVNHINDNFDTSSSDESDNDSYNDSDNNSDNESDNESKKSSKQLPKRCSKYLIAITFLKIMDRKMQYYFNRRHVFMLVYVIMHYYAFIYVNLKHMSKAYI